MRVTGFMKLLFGFLILIFALSSAASAEVIVEPFGISTRLDAEESSETAISLSNNGEADVDYKISFEIVDPDENLDQVRGPRRDDRCDPDDMDYEWRDNDEDDGPEYEWIDITEFEDVREFNFGDDDNTGELDLGFVFPFWDEEYDVIFIDTDGWASFTVADDPFSLPVNNYPMQAQEGQENDKTIAVFQEDNLDGTDIFFWTNEEDFAIMTWSGDHRFWFQMLINDKGLAVMQYGENIAQNEGMIGVNHGDGEHGWYIHGEDANYCQEGRAIGFGPTNSWLSWVTAEPKAGAIAADEAVDVTLLFNAVEMDAGTFHALFQLSIMEPEEERDGDVIEYIEMSCVLTVDDPVAPISGTVIDADTEQPMAGVTIYPDTYLINRYTDEDGNYLFDSMPEGEYELTFKATDYLTHTEVVDHDGRNDLELDVAMLFAECNLNREDVFIQLEPVVEVETDFSISNDGNGPLTYTSEKRLIGDPVEPWGIYGEAELEDVINDPSVQGVAYVDGLFYVSGGYDSNADTSYIYVLSQEEGLVDQFMQFNASRYGMRDLAYDGEHLWGVDGDVIYEFTTDGEEISTIQSPRNPSRALAYDPDLDLIWVADVTSDLYGLTREGEVAVEFDRPDEIRFYGLAYWKDDPDGYNLYAFSRPSADEPIEIYKMDTETGDVMLEATLTDFEGRPGGAFITSELDPYHWLFVSLIQRPYKISVFEIEPRRDWFQHSPTEGVIEAGNSQEFTLVLDARGLPIETFEGEIVFYHDGIGSMTILPVTLDVVEGEVQTFRELELGVGWNTVSVGLRPEPSDVTEIMSELVENGSLIMMKNGAGDFFWPEYEHNDISGWYVDEGYQIKMSRPGGLRLEGMSVLADHPIELESGWSLISYYPRIDVEATLALSNLEDVLLIAKDGSGNFYVPAWEFSNMGDLSEGNAYYVNIDVEEPLEFVYTTGFEAEENESFGFNFDNDRTGVLPEHAVTGYNMSLLVMSETQGEVGVYADGNLVGSGVLNNGRCGIAVWGDDPSTEEIDGARDGEALEIRLLDGSGANVAEYEVLEGGSVYRTNTFSALKVSGTVEMPVEFGIVSAYPNPFNAMTRISYGLEHSGRIDLSVYDLTGRRVAELFSGEANAGMHTIQFNAEGFASGMYMLNLRSADRISQMKIVLVK